MRITGMESNAELLAEIGQRIRDARIATPLTRAELARKSGVSVRTVANVEFRRGATLENVINILRALDLVANLEVLVPEYGPRPTDLASLGKKRERATSAKARRSAAGEGDAHDGAWCEASVFMWGEDQWRSQPLCGFGARLSAPSPWTRGRSRRLSSILC